MDDQGRGLDGMAGPAAGLERVTESGSAGPTLDDVIAELYYAAADLRRRPITTPPLRMAELLERLARTLERRAGRVPRSPPPAE